MSASGGAPPAGCAAPRYVLTATPRWPWPWAGLVEAPHADCAGDKEPLAASGPALPLTVSGLQHGLPYDFALALAPPCAAAPSSFSEPYVADIYEGPPDARDSSFYRVDTSPAAAFPPGFRPLPPAQKARMLALNTIFENGQLEVDYSYAEDIGDGRGITFGRCGFCTGTGDGLVVIAEYVKRKPAGNVLAKYLEPLRVINSTATSFPTGNVQGLQGFEKAVAAAAKDPVFRKVQDDINDLFYFRPLQLAAAHYGVRLPLTKGQLFDSYINHGFYPPGDEQYPNSANALIDWTNERLGGAPGDGVDEKAWLAAFLWRRWYVIAKADKVWASSVNRVKIYQYMANAGQFQLDAPFKLFQGCCGPTGVCAAGAGGKKGKRLRKAGARGAAVSGMEYGIFSIP